MKMTEKEIIYFSCNNESEIEDINFFIQTGNQFLNNAFRHVFKRF